MNTGRDKIFAAIARATTTQSANSIAQEAAAFLAQPETYRPGFSGQSNFDRFVEKATSESVTATIEVLDSLKALPAAVMAYLQQNQLPAHIALQPRRSLVDLDWSGFATHSDPAADEAVAITIADMGVAETGSLVFLTGYDAPVLMNFLPLHHLAVLRQSQIHRHLEDVFDRVGKTASDQPRSINIITGTSGTADIEAKNIRGAHGPRYMHIYCLSDIPQGQL